VGRTGDRGVERVLIEPFLEVPDEGFELGDPLEKLSTRGQAGIGDGEGLLMPRDNTDCSPFGKSN